MNSNLKLIDAHAMDDQLIKKGSLSPAAAAMVKEPNGSGRIVKWVKKLLPSQKNGNDDSLRDAIEELIEEKENEPQSAVAAHEKRLISNILDLRDLPVVDVMVPRADIVAIDINSTKEELMAIMAEKPHSRLPVHKGDLDHIVGVLNIKDLVSSIATSQSFELKDLVREAMVVSPAMRVMDLLLQMRQSKVHVAFVVDEFGGIDGLITINDLIEAIVGEIDDEFEFEVTPQLIERPDGTAIADARYSVESFEQKYGNIFDENEENEEADTLGGLVSYIAGYVPTRGEVIRHSNGIEFEVLDADPRRIMRLRIRNLPQKTASLSENE